MNPNLIKISKVLGGYTIFVEKVRKYEGLNIQLQNAIERAIEECINEDILTDFFKEHRVEVTRQAMLDFTFERQLELERRDRYEEGMKDGIAQGITAGSKKHLLALICRKLKKNKSLENIAEELEEDISVVEPLYIFAQGFAPDYNEEQVFEAYKNTK